SDARVAHGQLVREHTKLESALAREKEESRAIHQELLAQIDETLAESNQVDAENRQMQAELHEAQSRCAELESGMQGAEAARRMVGVLETERATFKAKHAGAVEHVNRLELQLADAERDARAAAIRFRDDQSNLKDALEDLTERNHELKQQLKQQLADRSKYEESNFFVTAINDSADAIPALPSSPKLVQSVATQTEGGPTVEGGVMLTRAQVEDLKQNESAFTIMSETVQALKESKERYKAENAELTAMAETARQEIKTLRQQLASSGSSGKGGIEGQLREAETRLREVDERNLALMAKNDELVQRTGRLEMELSDLQMRCDDSAEELSMLHSQLDESDKEIQKHLGDNEQLRQTLAAKEVELDDAQGALDRAQRELALVKKSSAEAPPRDSPSGSANTSPTLDRPSRVLAQAEEDLERVEMELAATTASHAKNLERLEKARKEQRY
ncbi:hypothetical protein IWW38_005534, partial [Coemansia aciculifera]